MKTILALAFLITSSASASDDSRACKMMFTNWYSVKLAAALEKQGQPDFPASEEDLAKRKAAAEASISSELAVKNAGLALCSALK